MPSKKVAVKKPAAAKPTVKKRTLEELAERILVATRKAFPGVGPIKPIPPKPKEPKKETIPARVLAVREVLKTRPFGCQYESVVNLMTAVLGCKKTDILTSPKAIAPAFIKRGFTLTVKSFDSVNIIGCALKLTYNPNSHSYGSSPFIITHTGAHGHIPGNVAIKNGNSIPYGTHR